MTNSFRDTATKILKAAEPCIAPHECPGLEAALATAIRELADQMVPEPSDIDKGFFSLAAIRERCRVRDAILAIATELENAQ